MAPRTTLTLIMVALFGCGSTSGGGTGGGGGSGGGGGGGGAGGTATCMDTLKCVAACASGDGACIDACDAAASTARRNQLLALLSCMDTNQCADVSCVETNCGTQLNTCVTECPTSCAGTFPDGTPPVFVVPTLVVGTGRRLARARSSISIARQAPTTAAPTSRRTNEASPRTDEFYGGVLGLSLRVGSGASVLLSRSSRV